MIWPLTIVKDRYNGAYSGGRFIAWEEIPENVPSEPDEGDNEARSFWEDNRKVCGKGATPDEAIEDLELELKDANGCDPASKT